METNLYDRTGNAVAYIAEDAEHSIYTWDGRAVCYLVGDAVYGWNGRHIGWFLDGVLYDLQGFRVGSIQGKCPVITHVAPVKLIKLVKLVKNVRQVSFARPVFSSTYSATLLRDFVMQGAS